MCSSHGRSDEPRGQRATHGGALPHADTRGARTRRVPHDVPPLPHRGGLVKAYMLVQVDLDPIPGDMHTDDSARENIQAVLNHAIGHYRPSVLVLNETELEGVVDKLLERTGIHRD